VTLKRNIFVLFEVVTPQLICRNDYLLLVLSLLFTFVTRKVERVLKAYALHRPLYAGANIYLRMIVFTNTCLVQTS